MVKHYVLWKLKEEYCGEGKATLMAAIQEGLEGLVGTVPGLLAAKVTIGDLPSCSGADLMLECTLESPEALRAYAVHPAHQAVANSRVRPYTASRVALDCTL